MAQRRLRSTMTFEKVSYSNGDIYEGELEDGKRHGRGRYEYNTGDIYEGDYANDEACGSGTFTFASGSRCVLCSVKLLTDYMNYVNIYISMCFAISMV